MWFKFKNVATLIVKTFNLLLITILFTNPFNAKQIASVLVMASTSGTNLIEIMPNDAAVKLSSASTKITATSPSKTATSTTSTLPNSFSFLTTINDSDNNKMYNSTFIKATAKNVTNEIDILSDESTNSEIGLLGNYIMTKHIALSSISTIMPTTTQLPVTTAEIETKTTSTNRKLLSSSTPILLLQSSLPPVLADDSQMSFYVNKSQLNVLASFSLLSSKEPLKEETTSLTSTSSSSFTTASVSSSTLIFPNHQASITALKHKGNEQSMRNTNSHLTVDNANVTIVATSKTNTKQQLKNNTVTKLTSENISSIYKGSSSYINSGSRSGSEINTNLKDFITTNGNNNRSNTSTTRISARKVNSRYILSKAHKTDAPMLNYIFDTFSSANKHHHHDQRYGPHFEDVQLVGQPTNMTVQAGSSIHLNCRISLLQDKTVSWVRRNSQGENALDLLTVGLHTYTGDKRYKMEFQYPSNWRLKINNVKKDDEATYECQISTHPPRVIQINLHVNAPKVMIVDEFGDPLQDKYYEQDSTLQLACVVRNVAMSSAVVFWKHSDEILNYDVTRGGVSVKTELMEDGANSTLFIAKINKADSGNYTCSISEYQNYTIVVHILNGESFAELHHGAAFGWQELSSKSWRLNLVLVTILLLLLPAFINR